MSSPGWLKSADPGAAHPAAARRFTAIREALVRANKDRRFLPGSQARALTSAQLQQLLLSLQQHMELRFGAEVRPTLLPARILPVQASFGILLVSFLLTCLSGVSSFLNCSSGCLALESDHADDLKWTDVVGWSPA